MIATTLGGPAELVTDGADGVLVDPGDETAFAQALSTLMSDAARRTTLAEHGLESVAAYSWSAAADVYEAIWDSAETAQPSSSLALSRIGGHP